MYRLPGTLSKLELFFPAGFWLDESSNLIVPINPSFLMDHEIWDKYFRLKGFEAKAAKLPELDKSVEQDY